MQELQKLREIVHEHLVANRVTHLTADNLMQAIEEKLKEQHATSTK